MAGVIRRPCRRAPCRARCAIRTRSGRSVRASSYRSLASAEQIPRDARRHRGWSDTRRMRIGFHGVAPQRLGVPPDLHLIPGEAPEREDPDRRHGSDRAPDQARSAPVARPARRPRPPRPRAAPTRGTTDSCTGRGRAGMPACTMPAHGAEDDDVVDPDGQARGPAPPEREHAGTDGDAAALLTQESWLQRIHDCGKLVERGQCEWHHGLLDVEPDAVPGIAIRASQP